MVGSGIGIPEESDVCSSEGKDGKAPESNAITQNLQEDMAYQARSVNDKYIQKISTK